MGKTARDNILRDLKQLGYGKGFGLLQYVVFSFAVIAMLPIDTFSPSFFIVTTRLPVVVAGIG